jgi:hypothetical protein
VAEERNRASRFAAKHVPRRLTSRTYSARAHVLHASEELFTRLRDSPLSTEVSSSVEGTLNALTRVARDVRDGTPGARKILNETGKNIDHLALAFATLTHSQRLLERLLAHAPDVAAQLRAAAAPVIALLRENDTSGALLSAVAHLRETIEKLELNASRAA